MCRRSSSVAFPSVKMASSFKKIKNRCQISQLGTVAIDQPALHIQSM